MYNWEISFGVSYKDSSIEYTNYILGRNEDSNDTATNTAIPLLPVIFQLI